MGGMLLYNRTIAIMLPPLGGGTTKHAKEMAFAWSNQKYNALLVETRDRFFEITVIIDGETSYHDKCWAENPFISLTEIFYMFNVVLIHIQHVLGMNMIFFDFIKNIDIPYVVTLHDYYTICPYINLTGINNKYCGEKGIKYCNNCIQKRGADIYYDETTYEITIEKWRNFYYNFLLKAQLIIVPSNDTKYRIQKYYNGLPIKVIENPEIFVNENNDQGTQIYDHKNEPILKIGLIGFLTEIKGSSVLIESAIYAAKKNMPISFTVFGEIEHRFKIPSNITVLGKYNEKDIFKMIIKQNIDYFWFPVQCPETYSYVLTIPIKLKIPVVGADIGAVSERIQKNEWGKVYQWDLQISSLVSMLTNFDYKFYRNKLQSYKIENDSFGQIESYYSGVYLKEKHEVASLCKIQRFYLQMSKTTKLVKMTIHNLTIFEFKILSDDCGQHFFSKINLCYRLNKNDIYTYIKRHGLIFFTKKLIKHILRP